MFNAFDLINLFYVSAILLFIWSAKTFSTKFAIFEFIIAFSFALIFETYNISVSAHYSYPNSYFYIGKVSVEVLMAWYTAYLFGKYWIISILSLTKKIDNNSIIKFLYPTFFIANGYITATLVMLIDPFASRTEWWKWFESTPFLGVPVGELYGIFISVVFISILIVILHNLLSNYFENDVYEIKNLDKFDLLIFTLYEVFCLLGLYMTIAIASSNSDVLMGAIVVYLATQIIPFITLILYFSSDSFHKDFNILYENYRNVLKGIIILMSILSVSVGIISIFAIIPDLKVYLPDIASFHMVMTQFTMVLGAITLTLYLKYRSMVSQSLN